MGGDSRPLRFGCRSSAPAIASGPVGQKVCAVCSSRCLLSGLLARGIPGDALFSTSFCSNALKSPPAFVRIVPAVRMASTSLSRRDTCPSCSLFSRKTNLATHSAYKTPVGRNSGTTFRIRVTIRAMHAAAPVSRVNRSQAALSALGRISPSKGGFRGSCALGFGSWFFGL